MADLKLAPGFEEALRARLQSPEGQHALTQFAALLAKRVVETFPPELLDTLETAEGRKAFEEAWPSIVDAYFPESVRAQAEEKAVKVAYSNYQLARSARMRLTLPPPVTVFSRVQLHARRGMVIAETFNEARGAQPARRAARP
jgi:hypothetical protein